MDVMVGADARQPPVLAAPTPRAARDDTADSAELHAGRRRSAWSSANAGPVPSVTLDPTLVDIQKSVRDDADGVYSPAVLRLRDQASRPKVNCQTASREAG